MHGNTAIEGASNYLNFFILLLTTYGLQAFDISFFSCKLKNYKEFKLY